MKMEGGPGWKAQRARGEARERMAELVTMLEQMKTLDRVFQEVPGKKLYSAGLIAGDASNLRPKAGGAAQMEERERTGGKIRSDPELVAEDFDPKPLPLDDDTPGGSGRSTTRRKESPSPQPPEADCPSEERARAEELQPADDTTSELGDLDDVAVDGAGAAQVLGHETVGGGGEEELQPVDVTTSDLGDGWVDGAGAAQALGLETVGEEEEELQPVDVTNSELGDLGDARVDDAGAAQVLGDETVGKEEERERPSTAAALRMLGSNKRTRSYRKELELQKSLAKLQNLDNNSFSSTAHSLLHGSGKYRMVEPLHINETVDKSFMVFGQPHALRLACWMMHTSRIMRGLFLLTAVTNNALIALSPENIGAETLHEWDVGGVLPAREEKIANAWAQVFQWVDLFDVICVFVLFCEVLIGMIALGVWAPRRKCLSWLTSSVHHSIDLFVLCFAIAEYALILMGFKSVTMRSLRLLRLLSLITLLPSFAGVDKIVQTLYEGMGQVLTVFAVLLFLWAALSIFGMAMYQNSFRRYCALAPIDVPWTTCASTDFSASSCPDPRLAPESAVLSGRPSVVGGGYPFRRPCKSYRNSTVGQWDGVYPLSSAGVYHTCLGYGATVDTGFSEQECVIGPNVGGNTSSPFGFVHFDHAGGAMLALSQYSLTDAAYDILHTSLSSEPGYTQGLTYTFYILTSALCTFLCLGLFVAVVTGTFHRVGEEQKQLEQERENMSTQAPSLFINGHGEVQGGMAGGMRSGKPSFRAGKEGASHATDQRNSDVLVCESSGLAEVSRSGVIGSTGSVTAWGGKFGKVGHDGDGSGVMGDEAGTEREEKGSIHMVVVGCGDEMASDRALGEKTGKEDRMIAEGGNRAEQVPGKLTGGEEVEGTHENEGRRAVKESSNFLGRSLKSLFWRHLASLFICAHLVGMSMDQYLAPEAWTRYVFISYIVCNSFFGLELLLQLIAAGPRGFWQHYPNRAGIVVSSCALAGLLANIKVLQLIPAVRLYRLMQYVPTLEGLLLSAVTSSGAIINLLVFILFVATCFGVAGRYVIGNDMDNITRSNFGTLQSSLLTIFQVFTGDSWSSVLFSAMHAKQNVWGEICAAVLILFWLAFAKLICSNLFVSIIIENFHVSETIESIKKAGALSKMRRTFARSWGQMYRQRNANAIGALHVDSVDNTLVVRPREMPQVSGSARAGIDDLEDGETVRHGSPGHSFGTKPNEWQDVHTQDLAGRSPEAEGHWNKKSGRESSHQSSGGLEGWDVRAPLHRFTSFEKRTAVQTLEAFHRPPQEAGASMERIPILFKSDTIKLLTHQKGIRALKLKRRKPQRVLFFFFPTNPVRRFFVYVGNHPVFDLCVYLAIIASCVILIISPAYDDIPGNEPLLGQDALSLCNLIFTIVFTVEFFCRVLSHGLLQTHDAYLRSAWNCVDFAVLVVAWVDVAAVFDKGYIARIGRLFRALRPLRLMKRNVGMRVVIDALISTLPPVMYVILFGGFNFFVFAVIGMGIFGGRLYRCSLPGAEYPGGLAECSGTHARAQDGLLLQRVWDNPGYSFDSLADSVMLLFQINTLKYVSVLESVMDVTEINKSPVPNAAEYHAIFIIVYVVVGSLFVMNLFVGFIVDGFHANKGDSKVDVLYTRLLRQLVKLRSQTGHQPKATNRVSVLFRGFVESRAFQLWSVFCVSANVGVMLSDHAGASEEFQTFMRIQNLVFFTELCIEVLFQAIAYGPKGFFYNKWRVFDLIVALGAGCGYVLDDASITQFSKGFRLMRVIRLMRMFTPVRIILETLIQCVPQLANILLLLFLVYSMFAVVAVQLYSTTKFGQRLGPTANFQTFFGAMLTCYQLVTGDEWHIMLADCSVVPPSCTEQFDGFAFGDCGSRYSFIYFATLKIICESVMLNLYVGVILDNFSFITEEIAHVADARWTNGPSTQQLAQLAVHFQRYDAGTGRMPLTAIRSFMCAIPQPLGLRGEKGAILYSKMDKTTEKLVRAELLLFVREDHMKAHLLSRRFRRFVWRWHDKFNMSVTFEEVVLTLLHWRLPEMTPDLVKLGRETRIQDVIMTVHMLVLKDFLLNLVARRKQQRADLQAAQQPTVASAAGTDGAETADA